jgi:hypothetical protein
MIASNKRYVDPTNVVKNIVDDTSTSQINNFFLVKPILIGDEKDVGEFNFQFLSCVSEGLIQSI